MKVKDWMSRSVVSLDLSSSLEDIARVMREGKISSVVITDGGKPVGMITERDLVIKVIAKGLDYKSLRAKDIMSFPLITINKDKELEEAANLMIMKGIRRLVVIEDETKQMVGIITTSDIARSLAKEESLLLKAIALYHEEGY
ncbi:MAG: CBS domain-containing protein [Nitrososphaerales archaeon]